MKGGSGRAQAHLLLIVSHLKRLSLSALGPSPRQLEQQVAWKWPSAFACGLQMTRLGNGSAGLSGTGSRVAVTWVTQPDGIFPLLLAPSPCFPISAPWNHLTKLSALKTLSLALQLGELD